MINPTVNYMSSIGEYVDSNAKQLADYMIKEIMGYLPESSLAMKIIRDNRGHFTEKQLWVIAYELQKNAEYCAEIDKTLAEIEQRENMRKAHRAAKRHAKGEAKNIIASTTEVNNFEAGDVVKHNTFGEGTVIAIDEKTITINFNEVGEKKLLKAFVRLSK